MALSGSVTATGGYNGKLVMLEWSASQNIANNTSTISWTLKGTGGSGWHEAGNFKVVIDGDTVYNNDPNPKLQLWNGTVVATGSKTITHNADGTRSFSVSFECGIYYYAVNTRGSGTFTLDTIPRASSISLDTNTQYIGSVINVTISAASSSFTNIITFAFGNESTSISRVGSTTVKWTLPPALYAQIPNADRGVGTITCDTYSSGTYIGSSSVSFYALVSSSQSPTVTMSGAKTGQTTLNCYVASKNGITLTATPSSYASSSIKSIAFYDGSTLLQSGASATCSIGTLSAGSHTLKVVVTDSRGFTGQNTLSITVQSYAPPAITGLTAYRTLNGASDTNRNNAGTYILVNASYTYSSCDGLNTLSVSNIQYKATSAAAWSDFKISAASGTNYWGSGFGLENDYEIRVVLTDAFNTIYSSITTVFGSYKLISFNGVEGGVAFGQVCTDEKFTVNMPAVFKKGIDIGNNATGSLSRSSGNSWIKARDLATVKQTKNDGDGTYNPVASVKTKNGNWSIGALGNTDHLYFSYDTDDNYNINANRHVCCRLYIPPSSDFDEMSLALSTGDYYPQGGWYYAKIWPGFKVAKKNFSWTGTIDKGWGSLYESSIISLGNFPPNFFTSTPMVFLQPSNNYAMTEGVINTTSSYVGDTFLCRGGGAITTPLTFRISILAISLEN